MLLINMNCFLVFAISKEFKIKMQSLRGTGASFPKISLLIGEGNKEKGSLTSLSHFLNYYSSKSNV